MKIEPIIIDSVIHRDMLQEFCNECKDIGYENNSSFHKMKLEWIKKEGEYFCMVEQGKIIAVAGCHRMPEMGEHAWRILFRGCELPGKSPHKGLSKGDWNSLTQRYFIPRFIEWCPSVNLYITTHEGIRNHRTMSYIARQGILDYEGDMNYFNKTQSIWKLNIDEYTKRRNKLRNYYNVG
ncbi:MAG: hypothetical protein CMD98_06305 [Gammaproteobacteria bacterium]|nr:hypothetical protein [Gammaproteobacteria bacterium]